VKEAVKRFRNLWSEGPVHLNRSGYNLLAKHVVKNIGASSTVRSSATEAGPGSSGQGQRRPSWVSADEAVASRTDVRGRGNFRGKWRGKSGGHSGAPMASMVNGDQAADTADTVGTADIRTPVKLLRNLMNSNLA
jgi:hypothetical protein